jgi:phosphomannomutase
MIAVGAIFGGEGNGGPIDPRVGYVRDSFVGMAQVLDLMALTNLPLSSLCDRLPSYVMIKSKFSLNPSKLKDALSTVADLYPTAIHDWQDGLRIVWNDSWLLIRGSNTEPVVRIITEAPCQKRADELCRSVLVALQAL